MTEPVIDISHLSHDFGTKLVVDDLSLKIPKGCIFGLLGRNGAGKTTTIRILMGLFHPTRGQARVLGKDSRFLDPETKAKIGYLAEGHHVYSWMSIEECRRFQKAFYSHWNDDLFMSVIRHFRLDPKAKSGRLSRGQRAGLCLALTLAPEPELLILDDPALGLDPVARRSLLESMVYVTRSKDRTILFSSHLLSDVERVADEIAVVQNGRLRAQCSIDEFRGRIRSYVLKFKERPPSLPDRPWLLQSFRTDRELFVTIANPGRESAELLQGTGAEQMEETALGLEEAFISYVGDRGEKTFFLQNQGGMK